MIIKLEQNMPRVKSLEENISSLGDSLNIEELAREIESLEAVTGEEGFWNDLDRSKKVLAELKRKKGIYTDFITLKKGFEDLKELIALASEAEDEALADEIIPELTELEKDYQIQRIAIMLSGEFDRNNAILTIHPGAGGTEAQDWAAMLYRMYCRFAERNKFKVKVLDYLEGEEAGIKSVSILVSGENAYGYLKGEAGVHRLVRISPFDSSGRRHTSFASVDVIPEMNDDIKIEINESDLKVETHRSSGAGGQHINKTDSAVRITHLPTGIVVGCQTERSQMQNRETALKMLKSKLLEIKEREHFEKIEDIKGVKLNIEWGSQIRSYVFMPYTLVKDNRTGYETGSIDAVMDGDLNGFIDAYLKSQVKK